LVKHSDNGAHHVTIPNHNPIKLGTLASIVSDVSDNLRISKEDFF